MPTTVYAARRILTMNPSRPEATHVAVRDGRILGVGPLEDLAGWGPYELDERFADRVLMPGLVEGHSHLMAGTFWRFTYCGYFGVLDPQGRTVAGSPSLEAVVAALCAVRLGAVHCMRVRVCLGARLRAVRAFASLRVFSPRAARRPSSREVWALRPRRPLPAPGPAPPPGAHGAQAPCPSH